jgi:Putative prokaryotic signal transducing protein
MWKCSQCGADVETGFEICWGCGTAPDGSPPVAEGSESSSVMEASTYEAIREKRLQEELVTVGAFLNSAEAHLLASRLEAEGVDAVVADEDAASMTWGINNSGCARLLVPEAQRQKAQAILEACKEEQENRHSGLAPRAASDEDTDAETVEERLSSSEHLAKVAYRSAIFGVAVSPVSVLLPLPLIVRFILALVFQCYSVYLLFRLMIMPGELSPAGERRCWIALLIDLAVFGFVGLMIYLILFRRW